MIFTEKTPPNIDRLSQVLEGQVPYADMTEEERIKMIYFLYGIADMIVMKMLSWNHRDGSDPVREGKGGEDLVQELVSKIIGNYESGFFEYRGRGSYKGWVIKSCKNHVYHFLKWVKRRESVFIQQVDADDLMEVEQPVSDPEDGAKHKFDLEEAVMLMEGLKPNHQEILLLHLKGLTHPQIAEILGITEGASKGRLHRAREALRNMLLAKRTIEEVVTGR